MREKEKPGVMAGRFNEPKNISHPTSARPPLQVKIAVSDFRPYQKNTLHGFFTIQLPEIGLKISDCMLHEKNGSRWISFPAKPFKDANGELQYQNILGIEKEFQAAFQQAALQAIDNVLGEVEQR